MVSILICSSDSAWAEALALQLTALQKSISEKLSIKYTNISWSLSAEDLRKTDTIFLDMEKSEDIDFAGALCKARKDIILILSSDSTNFASHAYKVNSFRYIPKNSLSSVLSNCLEKALEKWKSNQAAIAVYSRRRKIFLKPLHILYIKKVSAEKKMLFYLESPENQTITASGTLAKMETLLAGKGFLRIHHSYLVNMLWIEQVSQTEILLQNGTKLPISEKNYIALKHCYHAWLNGQQNEEC